MEIKGLPDMPDADKNRVHAFADWAEWGSVTKIDVTPCDAYCTDIAWGGKTWRIANWESSSDYLTEDDEVHEIFVDGEIRYHTWSRRGIKRT